MHETRRDQFSNYNISQIIKTEYKKYLLYILI